MPFQRSRPRHPVFVGFAFVGCTYATGMTIPFVVGQGLSPTERLSGFLLALGFGIVLATTLSRKRPALFAISYTTMLFVFAALGFLTLRNEPGPILVLILWGPFLLGLPLWLSSLTFLTGARQKHGTGLEER